MANYTASALLAAQANFIPAFEQPEVRRKQDPALMLAMKNMQVTIPGHQELRKKDTRPVKAYIRIKRAPSATTAKAYNHTGTKADSKEVTLSWVQFVEPFTVYRKAGQSNMFDYAAQLGHEMAESARNLHSRAGTAALAYLQTNRSQVAAPSTGGAGAWNGANFALEIAGADEKRFYQNLASFMRRQNYRGQLDIISDSTAYRRAEFLGNQGNANQENLSFQFKDLNISESTEDIDANYANGCALVMPAASFAGLPWNDPLNIAGEGSYDEYTGGFGVVQDPLGSGLLFDFHAYTQRADGSAQGGGIQDLVLEAEMTLTIGWVTPPLSAANESVVWEVAQGA
ncbi:hypothetical protein [Puia sp.]|jgi:hypothetical protein|uniref:hypothetical protein n=1 Tax=Puia sp. TaxID=2045100 RepID=UPI002F405875